MVNSCQVMVKPTGFTCNLSCRYCFYLEKEKLYQCRSTFMSDETLENYIKGHIEAQSTDNIPFSWQGGEPTMMGLTFFARVVLLQNKYRGNKSISNSFQTNGVLIDDEWCSFFKRNNFLIGISIDGPEDLHDAYRLTRSGKGTHHKVGAIVKSGV